MDPKEIGDVIRATQGSIEEKTSAVAAQVADGRWNKAVEVVTGFSSWAEFHKSPKRNQFDLVFCSCGALLQQARSGSIAQVAIVGGRCSECGDTMGG